MTIDTHRMRHDLKHGPGVSVPQIVALMDAYDQLVREQDQQNHTSAGVALNADQLHVWGNLTRADVIMQAERMHRNLMDTESAYNEVRKQRDALQRAQPIDGRCDQCRT